MHIDRLNAAALEALRANVALAQLDDATRKDILDRLAKAARQDQPALRHVRRRDRRHQGAEPQLAARGAHRPTASPSATG